MAIYPDDPIKSPKLDDPIKLPTEIDKLLSLAESLQEKTESQERRLIILLCMILTCLLVFSTFTLYFIPNHSDQLSVLIVVISGLYTLVLIAGSLYTASRVRR